MGRYYLCQERQAEHPYYIVNAGVNIYTIEELCFYLQQNVYLIDRTIVGEELCHWLADELGFAVLAKKLLRQLDQEDGQIVNFIMMIFKEAGYLTPREARQLRDEIAGIEIQPEDIRRKMKADHLVGRERYSSAVYEYYRILRNWNQGNLGTRFFASVLNNMAVAYAGMFLFEEAADCLWQSYGMVRSNETWKRYLLLLPLYLSEEAYRQRLEELAVPREQIEKFEAEKAEKVGREKAETGDAGLAEFLAGEQSRYRKSSSSG